MTASNFCVAGFGEVMLRLSPPQAKRLTQTIPGKLEATFGGGEANVCASIAIMGGHSRFLTALPDNPVSHAFANQMRGIGCDVDQIHYADIGRLGIYYTEHGSNMRSSAVFYDRNASTISILKPQDYDFAAMLDGVTHLHLSGITPALSRNAFETTLALAEFAVGRSISISVDLNYRKKLWNWEPGTSRNILARRCMLELLSHADIIIGNEEDAADVFDIHAKDCSVESGYLSIGNYHDVAGHLSSMFPQVKLIAITLRESFSANHNNWGGMLYDCRTKASCFAPLDANGQYTPYQLHNIVDRFGAGDSFCAGLLFALNCGDFPTLESSLAFAAAASALKHTVSGDYNYVSASEIKALMTGAISGRVRR